MHNIWVYIFIMAFVTFLVRELPITLIQKEINNKFIRSFLYYVPYVTLSVMTFPAIIQATQSMAAGIAALILGVVVAWRGGNLFKVAVTCCLTVFILEFFIC